MERAIGITRTETATQYHGTDHNDLKCGECGEAFKQPLLAKLASYSRIQTYYACPRCLTEVPEPQSRKNEEIRETSKPLKSLVNVSSNLETGECAHSLGYLGKRTKNMSIPEECLTCERMIECMIP